MADENLNPRRDALRQALTDFMASRHDHSIDRMMEIMDQAIREAKAEAKAEAKREADSLIPIPNLTIETDMDYCDAISQRLNQAKGIADLMGAVDGEIEDASLPNAAWAVRQLLDEADELAARAILKH